LLSSQLVHHSTACCHKTSENEDKLSENKDLKNHSQPGSSQRSCAFNKNQTPIEQVIHNILKNMHSVHYNKNKLNGGDARTESWVSGGTMALKVGSDNRSKR
jgi:hypothetical protein